MKPGMFKQTNKNQSLITKTNVRKYDTMAYDMTSG